MKVGDLIKITNFKKNYVTFEGAHDTLPVSCRLKEVDSLLCFVIKTLSFEEKPARWLRKGQTAIGFLDPRQNKVYYATSPEFNHPNWCEVLSEA